MKNTVIFLFLVFTFTNSFSQFYTGNTSALKDVFFNHKFNTITKGLANFNYSNNAKYFKFQRNSFENMVINYDQNLSPGRVIRSFAFLIHSPKLTASFGEKVQVNVLASFFNSWYAYIIYGIIILLFYIFYRKREQKILLIQRKALLLRQQHKLFKQANKFSKEKASLLQEQLEKDKTNLEILVKEKTIQLAKKAKEDDDKNRLLHVLKEKLQCAQANPSKSPMIQKEISRLLETYFEEENKTFEIQMDELHQEFFKKAAKKYPQLSIYDLRLCAYLKIGITSSEIAEILNVQPSSIYVSRSRLRKKMKLDPEEDLFQKLNTI